MKLSKIMWGLFFIAAAALLVMNGMGFNIGLNLWSLLLTIVLIPTIVMGIMKRNFFNLFFGLGFLLIVYQHPLGIERLVPWTVLAAALLLSIGFSILFKPKYTGSSFSYTDKTHCGSSETTEHINSEDDEVSCRVNFGGGTKYIYSDSFQRGYFECSFGGLSVFFDNVVLHPNGAEIMVDCSFGAIELYIPREWNLVLDVDAMLGAVDAAKYRNNIQSSGPLVTIKGNVKLGAIEIKYI